MDTTFPADGLTSGSSPVLPQEHAAVRRRVREFALREIAPYANEWDEAETFPLALYKKAERLHPRAEGLREAIEEVTRGLARSPSTGRRPTVGDIPNL